ncbi:MAG: type II secretion system protein [Kiritimatiellae bacterium]|nr:type II secretion system protein [Kiritimatiellia bacterium]
MDGKSGMTLVELLVVLAILASLAASVAVSSSGMMDRARAEETRRQGEAMRDALERADGLSVVSDLGPIFDVETADESVRNARNLARLGFLFSPSNRFEITVIGGAAQSAAFKVVPPYSICECSLLPTNFAALAGIDPARASTFATVTNGLGNVALGCGWRGPYCRERVRDADGLLRDGFGGLWECAVTSTNCFLVSRGQDRAEDAVDAAKTWQERDQTFEVMAGGNLATLAVSLDESGVEVGGGIVNLRVFAYAPRLAIDDTADERAHVGVEAECRTFRNSPSAAMTGLSVGERVIFAVGEDAEGRFYAARPQRIVLRHGVNELLRLKIANRSE